MVGMFFGLPPACAGQSFDGEHVRACGTDAQGRSALPTWVKTTESPWDHTTDGDQNGVICIKALSVV